MNGQRNYKERKKRRREEVAEAINVECSAKEERVLEESPVMKFDNHGALSTVGSSADDPAAGVPVVTGDESLEDFWLYTRELKKDSNVSIVDLLFSESICPNIDIILNHFLKRSN